MQNRQSRKEVCSHNVYIKGLCGNCGIRLDPPQSSSVSMIHSVPELKVSEAYAKEIGKADQERLIREKKLVLLVDLDQTILHTTHEEVRNDPHVHSFQLWPGHPIYFTKLRPYLEEFLETMSKIYELHIFTFGCRMYAHKIASIIDPKQIYFGNRILSRDESVDQYSKRGNLNNLFPCGDAMVCIIDDRSDVWRDAGNLIQVKPYTYFKTSISDGAFARMSAQSSKKVDYEEEEESLDRDVDKLKALLGVDDDLNDLSESDSASGTGSESGSSHTEGDGQTQEAASCELDNRLEHGESSKRDLNKDEEEEEKEEEAVGARERLTELGAGDQKRVKLDPIATSSTLQRHEETTQVTNRAGKVQGEGLEREQENKAASNEFAKSDDEKPSMVRENEDSDDHLLKIQTILSRIHDKWYLELDEQRQFLQEGENYKLPDIKDIISRYLRKSYR